MIVNKVPQKSYFMLIVDLSLSMSNLSFHKPPNQLHFCIKGLLNFLYGEELASDIRVLYDQYAENATMNTDYRIPAGKIISDSFFKCPVRLSARYG